MASVKNPNEMTHALLFNSPLETGVRALVVLDAVYPKSLDLTTLTWFDHLVVHTGDIGGPNSLHPNVPQRSGEMLVRRRLIEDSLTLMRRLHLIMADLNKNGISYQASDEAYPFVELLRSNYATELKNRAKWLAENIANLSEEALNNLITKKLGRWDIEFQNNLPINERAS